MRNVCLLLVLFLGVIGCDELEVVDSEIEGNQVEKTLQLKFEKENNDIDLDDYNYVGYGYDATGFVASNKSVKNKIIDIEALLKDFPNNTGVTNFPMNEQDSDSYFGANAIKFQEALSAIYIIDEDYFFFKDEVNSLNNDVLFVDEKYLFGFFQWNAYFNKINIERPTSVLKSYLTDAFLTDLENKDPNYIIENYGTHVLIKIYTGVKMEIKYKSQTTEYDRKEAASWGLQNIANMILYGITQTSNKTSHSLINQNYDEDIIIKTFGGNSEIFSVEEGATDQLDLAKTYINNWLNSMSDFPVQLISIADLSENPIYTFVSDTEKKEALKTAVEAYLIKSKVNLSEGK